jgi:hypothetical protein
MGFKLAMPQFAASKSEPSALSQTHARLKAWWNGEASQPAKLNEATTSSSAQDAVIPVIEADWASIHPAASAALWGNGRTYPSNSEFESELIFDAGGAKASRIALFDGGAGALARVCSEKTAAKCEIFAPDVTLAAITEKAIRASKQAKRFSLHGFDWKPGSLPKSKADAAIFVFQGGHEGRIEAGAFCAERVLRAGASAVWLDFFARRDDEMLDDCRGYDARRFGTEEEATIAFSACGLTITGDDDWSALYLNAFDVAWRDLALNLGLRQASMIKAGGYNTTTAALENLICWKNRCEAIKAGKLMVKRYILTS